MPAPRFWLIAGPNGAGKSTLVRGEPLRDLLPVIHPLNADDWTLHSLQQRGYDSFRDAPPAVLVRTFVEASDAVFGEVVARLEKGEAVCVETVLSTDKYCPVVNQVAAAGGVDIAGLIFLGYPLHPPGNPEKLRDAHLPAIKAPMLFVQGARDAFGTPEELRPVIKRIKAPVELCAIEDADHSLKVPKKASRSQTEVDALVLDTIVTWIQRKVLKAAR